jgi:predicted ATPase
VALARQAPDHAHLSHAHFSLGHTLYTLGQFGAARESLEQGIAWYDPQQHRPYAFAYGQDPGVFNLATLAWVLWHLGYPDHALARMQEALALAQDLAHAPSLEHALTAAAQLHQFRREAEATQRQAEMGMAISRERGFQMRIAMGTMLQGWALACKAQEAEGMVQLRQGLIAYQATGAEAFGPYFLTLLAETYQHGGHTPEGLQVLAEACAMADKNGDHFRKAEIHRLTGELLLQPDIPDMRRAETCFQQALDIARRQQAKSLELRAAMSLSRLWQQQGKRDDARELLAPVYGWFTEGFDTADLKEAKAILDE